MSTFVTNRYNKTTFNSSSYRQKSLLSRVINQKLANWSLVLKLIICDHNQCSKVADRTSP